MVNKCLNCGLTIPEKQEFCDYCEEDLDEMVDNRSINRHDEVEVQGSTNPFFSNTRTTGRVLSNSDNVSSQLEDEDSSGYFTVLIVLTLVMAFMVAMFL